MKSNSKDFWKYVNSKRKNKCGVSELQVQTGNGTFIANSNEDKMDVLADSFSSVFTKENREDILYKNLSETCQDKIKVIIQDEVRKLLNDLNTSKSQKDLIDKLHLHCLHFLPLDTCHPSLYGPCISVLCNVG